ncbi:MAG: alternative ribosome rescue aminoacyl-tRNA hydrolase ArfB [Methylococcales bacterium]|nr:alternative ribosome rescue aminoacyl-tRNA hydrolase ArfB [Methylococcales bacterium]
MLPISSQLDIPPHEIDISAIRAQGSGGQNINKVATAVHLRFDINASSLPAVYKERLLALADQRISKDGVVIIKAQQFRTLEKNKEAAYDRLQELVNKAMAVPKKRKPTKPTKGSRLKRLDGKARQSKLKALRGKIKD